MRLLSIVFATLMLAGTASAAVPSMQIEDMQLSLPSDWSLRQDGLDAGKMILVFSRAATATTMFVQSDPLSSITDVFLNGSTMLMDPQRFNFNGIGWTVLETKKSTTGSGGNSIFVFGFVTIFEGNTYWGFSKSAERTAARTSGIEFLRSLK